MCPICRARFTCRNKEYVGIFFIVNDNPPVTIIRYPLMLQSGIEFKKLPPDHVSNVFE